MPYIQAGGPQKTSNNPAISDVYHSSNVFVNNVPVALWQSPGSSAAFAGIDVAPALTLDPIILGAAQSKVNDYLANPSSFYSPTAAEGGVKGNYAGTVEDGTTSTGLISTTPTASDIIPFLEARLSEAKRGMWRESGQGGKPSNPNITGIWTNLGYSGSPWTTDQTAWCAGFVNFALKGSGYRYVQTASAKAIAADPTRWNATPVQPANVQPGDIVLWKYSHVNFVYTVSGGKCTFVGGNQTPTSGSNNNPSDGDLTISYPGGTPATNPNIASIWRPSKS